MNNQLSPMNPIVSRVDLQMPNVYGESVEPLGSNPMVFSIPVTQETVASCKQNGQSESMSNYLNVQQYSVRKSELRQTQVMPPNLGEDKLLLPNKRKATTEFTSINPSPEKISIPIKRVAQMGSSPKSSGAPHLSAPSKRMSETQSKSPRTSKSSKKGVQVESITNKSQSVVSNNRNIQSEENSESVRAKLRESLTTALSLVSQNMTSEKGESKQLESASSTGNATKSESIAEAHDSSGPYATDKCYDLESASREVQLKDESGEISRAWKFVGQEFQPNPALPCEEALFGDSFLFNDELLQGNGLSWALDFDPQIPQVQEVEPTPESELPHDDVSGHQKEQADHCPETVASKIEEELFKLFGGVNKKYKEKGRSLLFNLKDRNNPELRERVMSGDIPPDRLCSMTAEELASKELSEWRMAKAEELDQMKVIPDSELDVRRLVKKTHKGEYQVEFDQDVSIVEDVPLNTSVFPQNHQKKSGTNAKHQAKVEEAKEDKDDGQCSITIPGEGADMQGLMVDDMRDLPPIVSLDEFMESLDKEPPFENLPLDSRTTTTPLLDNKKGDVDVESKAPKPAKDPGEPTLPHKDGVEDSMKQDADVKSTESWRRLDANIIRHETKGEHVWEGLLHLNLSSTANVIAIYKSGEKASTREWPGFFEIKGRVRLDAFDRFLKELPMSRSRALMIAHFALKEDCTDSERANLTELIDSYTMDQRLGYAEPTPGLELYLCPPRSGTVDMIINHLPKGYTEKLNDIDNGLIGILVWRKERITSPRLPNSSSQHKHFTKGQHLSSGKQLPDKDVNKNVNSASSAGPSPPTLSKPDGGGGGGGDDDDDVPPGFGPPGGARDDDDLPEFNFSGGPNPSGLHTPNPNTVLSPRTGTHHLHPGPPARQVEQMRELIQRYGQSGIESGNIPTKPWNDDDDDIPEWRPQSSDRRHHHHHHHHHRQLTPPPAQPTQKPTLMPHIVNQPFVHRPLIPLAKPMQPLQPPVVGQGVWWPSGPNMGGQTMGGQFLTAHPNKGWRPPNASSRNRNF